VVSGRVWQASGALDPADHADLFDRAEAEGLTPGGELHLAPAGGGLVLEEDVELGDEEVIGDAGEKDGKEGLESSKGLDGVVAAVVDGADGGVEEVRELVWRVEDVLDELVEVVGRERVGMVTGAEGVQVAGLGAGAAGSELGIAVRAAVGVAAHGPVAAARDLAADFEFVSRHWFWLLSMARGNVGTLPGWHVGTLAGLNVLVVRWCALVPILL
jgi:hypothetical protein